MTTNAEDASGGESLKACKMDYALFYGISHQFMIEALISIKLLINIGTSTVTIKVWLCSPATYSAK